MKIVFNFKIGRSQRVRDGRDSAEAVVSTVTHAQGSVSTVTRADRSVSTVPRVDRTASTVARAHRSVSTVPRAARPRLLRLATLALAFALVAVASPARAEGVYFSTADLLRDFFRTSKNVTYKKIDLDAQMRERLTRRLGYAPARPSYTFFIATTDNKIDGYALIDEEKGEHLPITFAVKLSPDGVVQRQEIVCYRESRGDEVRDARFRQQFVGKTARDPVAANLDIVAVSGATISSRAMATGVKRALVLFDELVRGQVVTASATTPRL